MSDRFANVWRKATVVAFLVFGGPTLISGCSFMFVKPPRKEVPGRVEAAGCTASMTAPAVDGVITGLQAVRTMFALSLSDTDYRGMALDRNTDITLGVVFMAVFGISAIYGVSNVNTCRAAGGEVATPYRRPATSPYQRPATRQQTNAERRADEAAEEAAVQARLRARAAAAARADAAQSADAGAPPADGGIDSPPATAPPVAPNQLRDDGR